MTLAVAVARIRTRRARRSLARRVGETLPALAGVGALLAAIGFGLAIQIGPLLAAPLAADPAPGNAFLVLVVYSDSSHWNELTIAEMDSGECAALVELIWNAPQAHIGVDESGNAIPVIDAWCVEP